MTVKSHHPTPSRAWRARTWAALALTLAWALTSTAWGEVSVISPVNDNAMVLTDAQERAIEERLWALQEATGVQMAVVTVESTLGVPIEDFSLDVAERWKGGSAQRDDGVLMTLATHDRRMRLEVGYGLEGVITDREAKALLDGIRPQLKSLEYGAGILSVIEGVHEEARGLTPGSSIPLAARAIGLLDRGTPAVALFLVSFLLGLLLSPMETWLPALSGKQKNKGPLRRLRTMSSARRFKTLIAPAWSVMALSLCALGFWKGDGLGAIIALCLGVTGMVAAFYQVKAHRTGPWRSGFALVVTALLVAFFHHTQVLLGEQAISIWFTGSLISLIAYTFITAPKGSWESSGGSYSSSSSSSGSWSSSSSSSSSSSYDGGGGSFGGGGASSSW